MGTALAGKPPVQPLIHFFRSDKLSGPVAGQDFIECPVFQIFDSQTLSQLFNALLNDGADTGVPSGIHQRLGQGVLLVSERN